MLSVVRHGCVLESGCLDRVGTAVLLVTRIYKDISPLLSCQCLWFDRLALFPTSTAWFAPVFSHASVLSGDGLLSSFGGSGGGKGDFFMRVDVSPPSPELRPTTGTVHRPSTSCIQPDQTKYLFHSLNKSRIGVTTPTRVASLGYSIGSSPDSVICFLLGPVWNIFMDIALATSPRSVQRSVDIPSESSGENSKPFLPTSLSDRKQKKNRGINILI